VPLTEHVSAFVPQAAQVLPPEPHWAGEEAVMQALEAEQHPVGHEEAVQAQPVAVQVVPSAHDGEPAH
jgi:hypothetical protein